LIFIVTAESRYRLSGFQSLAERGRGRALGGKVKASDSGTIAEALDAVAGRRYVAQPPGVSTIAVLLDASEGHVLRKRDRERLRGDLSLM
jgi:hypothetical protein